MEIIRKEEVFHKVSVAQILSPDMVDQSVQWVGYRLDDWGLIPGRGMRGILSLHYYTQTSPGPHPFYLVGTGGTFPGDKAVGLWSWPLTSI
jgi:hypothetical protein